MTMAEFFDATGADLSLVASDTKASQILILNHRTTPDLPVIWGVRMSMSVPLLWHEVVWQAEWGTYRGRDITGNAVVDGGLLSNFPIELFISDQPQVLAVMGERTTESDKVLGFLIDESLEVAGAQEPLSEEKIFDFGKLRSVQRIQNLINTLTQAHDKMVIDEFEHLVVRLPAKGFGTIEFGMTDERRNALIAAGRAATVGHFKKAEELKPERMSFGMKSLDMPEPVSPADKIATRLLEM
jgi:predicted acylesterase/phospholipase RssA